jgi:S1-C subfamily serine protease
MRRLVSRSSLVLALSCALSAALPAQQLVDVAAKVRPAVVTILAGTLKPTGAKPGEQDMEGSIGSGVFISPTEVITAYHVVGDADTVMVQLANGRRYPARVSRQALAADLALLRVIGAPANTPVAPLGDSDALRIAEPVFAIGAPLGMDFSVSSGILSARRQPEEFADFAKVEYLQTDAAINHGNSGGPLVNMRGEVVGVVSFILSSSGGSQGLGFAIASNTARALLIEQKMPWLGIAFTPLPPALLAALNVPGGAGYLVEHVARNSLGAKLGLRGGEIPVVLGRDTLMIGGDVILKVDGRAVDGSPAAAMSLRAAVMAIPADKPLVMQVLRAGRVVDLSVPLKP